MTEPSPAPSTAAPAAEMPKEARRAGITAFIGTTVEWFDFYIYGTASALVFGQIFFPDMNPVLGTLAAFGTFWVGFLARPIGGVVFGHVGDRIGRKTALVTTLSMMAVATAGVGLLPTYAQIGVLAPVLLIVLRMVQGVAMGGEWGGAVLIATEYAPKHKRILYGAFAQQGSPVGNLLATLAFLVIAQLDEQAFASWGWRVPFIASLVLLMIGLFIRLRMAETPEMTALLESRRTATLPIREVVRHHWLLVAIGVGAGAAGVAITYVKTTFALSWATAEIGFDRSTFLTVITVALVVQVIVQPFGAVLASRIDLRRAVLWMLLPEIVLLPLMFVLVQTGSLLWATVGMALATVPHAMFYAALAGILSEVFPVDVRYTATSLSYQLCTTVFAGTAPLVSQTLLVTTGSIWAVVALGLSYVVISIVCTAALVRRSSWATRELPARAAR